MARLHSGPKSGTQSKDVPLPHKLIERPGTHANGQRSIASWDVSRVILLGFEQPVVHFG
jgi:hypothetical protein